MPITDFLHSRGFQVFEGYSQQVPGQVADLIAFSQKPNIKVMEIGFNAGHSAELFLSNNPTLTLTSFDLGVHDYVPVAKEYIDTTFPNRHTLILGDSTIRVPQFIKENPTAKFDIIFIDGGHDLPIARSDLENCTPLAHRDTLLIMDDTIETPYWDAVWTRGPTRAWSEAISSGRVVETGRKDYMRGRGMSWGKYKV